MEEMIREFGSPSAWQEAKTSEWIERLINDFENETIFFEGQISLQLIRNGFAKHNFNKCRMILIDCTETVMEKRLAYDRKQPELFNEGMRNWLRFLRSQARELGVTIIDSSNLSEEELRLKFEKAINLSKGY